MPDYKQGKIYMIWSPNTDKVYIGSTAQPLHKRFHEHKRKLTGQKSDTTANEILLACADARIELIEDYPCATKAELNRREGQIMRGYDKRVNQIIAGRTAAEYRADNRERLAAQAREYNAKNKEQIAARARERYQQNREQIAAYRQRNKEQIAAQRREYNAKNKEQIAARARERYQRNREQIAAQRREYRQQPEVKARRNALARENRQRKKEQQHTASA